jgi:hypothetical protein
MLEYAITVTKPFGHREEHVAPFADLLKVMDYLLEQPAFMGARVRMRPISNAATFAFQPCFTMEQRTSGSSYDLKPDVYHRGTPEWNEAVDYFRAGLQERRRRTRKSA